MRILRVAAFKDNYIWLLINKHHECIVVDPGDARPVEQALSAHELTLKAILITHHHADHMGGVASLTKNRDIPVFGPRDENIKEVTHKVSGENQVSSLQGFPTFEVIDCPGHTSGHIAYYTKPYLFCGDTLFVGGCGRMFEGTPEQFHASLQTFAALPANTQVYCAHEYTLANLQFALQVEPNNESLLARVQQVKAMRNLGICTVPSLLGNELNSNPFLRTNIESVKKAAEQHFRSELNNEVQVFAAVRKWKDSA